MFRVFFALFITQAAILALSLSTSWPFVRQNRPLLTNLILLVFILPMAVIFAITLFYNFVRPRRLFLSKQDGFTPVFLVVAVMTALCVLLESLGTVYAIRYLREHHIVLIASFIALILVFSFCRRPRPGFCRKCHYDLTASLAFGRCPECGTPSMS